VTNFTDLDTCVRSLRDEMIAFTSELMAIASENHQGTAYPDSVRAFESRLSALGLPSERVEYQPAGGTRDESGAAVVLSGVETEQRTLYFSGHYDVVPVTIRGQCAPVLTGKTLFGRGSTGKKVDWRPCCTPQWVDRSRSAPAVGLLCPPGMHGGRHGRFVSGRCPRNGGEVQSSTRGDELEMRAEIATQRARDHFMPNPVDVSCGGSNKHGTVERNSHRKEQLLEPSDRGEVERPAVVAGRLGAVHKCLPFKGWEYSAGCCILCEL
jgi:hypothetical protein